jgi:hypothetical protein
VDGETIGSLPVLRIEPANEEALICATEMVIKKVRLVGRTF